MQDKVCRQYVKPFNTWVKVRTFRKTEEEKKDKRVYYEDKKHKIQSNLSGKVQTSIYNKLLTPFLQAGNRNVESQKEDKNNGF